jgi:signal transduction histidine kinase
MFPSSVTGIDAVFESETQTITFRIEEGKARLIGEGALYNPKYKDFQRGIHLADPELFKTDDGNNKEKYLTFSLTPSEEFFDTYETQGPITAVIVVVSSILATILVFFLYDFNVRREFNAKKDLLEARKQFMRFVSHEVRTPLNAVSMGLDLMQSEVAKVLGFDCSTSFRAEHDMIDDEAYENSDDGSGFNFDVENPAIDSSEKNPLPEKTSGAESLGASTDEVIISSQKAKSWFQLSQEIQGNAQGAVDILNDLLNYDKIEQGNLQLSLEMISIWELVEKAILEFKVPASSKKVSLCIAFGEETRTTPRAPDLPADIRCLQVAGDPVRLLQVVRNLMSNALKFTPVGGSIRVEGIYLADQEAKEGPLEESIYLEDDESTFGTRRGSIRVRVIDSGAGMSEAQLANLFQEGVQFNVNELQAGGGSK